MRILVVGDVVSEPGLRTLSQRLRTLKKKHHIDFTIVNGENASGTGMTPQQGDDIFAAGADVITLGNHAYRKRSILRELDENSYILRPANYPPQQPGAGYGIYDCNGYRLLVINLIGRCDMQFGAENPFLEADRILKRSEGRYDLAICEIHASATSEKLAMGYYLDGRCCAIYGTHTHVQTADERINPKGAGYITDIGMTGPIWSVLGVETAQSIALFRGDMTELFRPATGECALSGAIFEVDTTSGKCTHVERVFERVPES